MTLARVRALAFIIAIFLALMFVAISRQALAWHQSLAWQMNLLGSQRLLVQQMRIEVLRREAGAGVEDWRALEATAHEAFEVKFDVLQHGGRVEASPGTFVELTPPTSPAIIAQLEQVQMTWQQLHPLLHAAASPTSVDQASARAVAGVETFAPLLSELIDNTVLLYQADLEHHWLVQQIQQVALLAALLALLGFTLLTAERRLLQPLRLLREATQRISRGDNTQIVAQGQAPEFAPLIGDLETVRQKLSGAAEAQAALLAYSQMLLSATDERAMANEAVAVAARLLQADRAALVLPNGLGRLIIQAVYGWPPDFAGRLELQPGDQSQTGLTMQRGLAVIVDDYSDPQPFAVSEIVREHKLVSSLSVPVVLEGEVTGAMLVNTLTRRRFGEPEIQLLSLIANQSAVALSRVRLLVTERTRADQLEALRAIAADTLRVAEYDLPRLLDVIVERAARLLNAAGGSMGISEAGRGGLHIVSSHNLGPGHAGTHMADGEGLLGRVAQTREPLVVDDYQGWPGRSAQYDQANLHAMMGAPLLAGQRLVGAISVVATDPLRRFGPSDLHLLTMFAQQAALGIEQARLVAAERQRLKEAETLRQAGAIVASTLDQRRAVELILQQLAYVIPYDSATVQLLRDGYVEVVGGRGWGDLDAVVGVRFPIPGDNPNTVVVRERRSHIMRDAPQEYALFGSGAQSHIRGWLGVPLIVHDNLIGMLAVDSAEPAHFTPEHARLATAFADQVAIVFENSRLYQSAVRAAESQAILYQLGREIGASLEPEQVYQAIHHATAQLMPAEAFVIALPTQAGSELEAVYMIDRGERVRQARIPLGQGLTGRVTATGAPLMINDTENSADLPMAHAGTPELVRSILAVPLHVGESVSGMLSTQSYQVGAYTVEDLHFLELLAVNADIALSNARLFAQVRLLAITDSLTGLYNRRHFFALAEREFERVRRYQRPLGAIMADIDLFKRVNDAYGHAVGDEVLREVAVRCQAGVRAADLLARYGGEEFVALLPESDWEGTRQVAERVRQLVSDSPITTRAGPIVVTVSLGFALFTPGCPDLPALIEQADLALYTAKAAGRNRVESLGDGLNGH